MKYFFSVLIGALLFSCSKETVITPVLQPLSDADYTMQVTTYWSAPQFTVSAKVHITNIVGMVHSVDTFLWKPGFLATPGLKDVAETGNTTKMNLEIDKIITLNKASLRFNITPPVINGSVQKDFTLTQKYSNVSFASMIAPSPDWFIGINNFSLIKNNNWIKDTTINIFVYDAGTEDGDVFGYNNPATSPQANVSLQTASKATVLANGNASLARMATVRFTKN